VKRAFPLLLAFLATGTLAHAQQQEAGIVGRIFSKADTARQAVNASAVDPKAKADPALTSSLGTRKFESSAFSARTFDAGTFHGTRSATTGTYETRSFFGIKNPWFGRKVFATTSSSLTERDAPGADRAYRSGAFTVKDYATAGKTDGMVDDAVLPSAAAPREYRGPERNKRNGIDQFTQNLSKDLTIDDVRDLLNKGK
jgi:hypothetical protein